MEYRPLEITVVSAKDLKDVNLFSKMDVYAYVSISGDPRTKQRTPIDKDCGSNPSWNFTMKFNVDEAAANQNRLNLVFQIRCERSLGDRDIGEVHVPIKELLDKLGDGKSSQFVTYQVRKPSGKRKGELNFSYKFGDKIEKPPPAKGGAAGDEPVTAYPAAGSSSSYPPPEAAYPPPGAGGYPPPGAGHPPAGYPHQGGYPPSGYPPAGYGPPPPPMTGYGGYQQPPPPQYGGYQQPPPPPGYGYPPQGGYGYPPQQQQVKPPKKSKFGGAGMGLGAGLLGGALGGLLIGDMISDAGGFDDGGGFDF